MLAQTSHVIHEMSAVYVGTAVPDKKARPLQRARILRPARKHDAFTLAQAHAELAQGRDHEVRLDDRPRGSRSDRQAFFFLLLLLCSPCLSTACTSTVGVQSLVFSGILLLSVLAAGSHMAALVVTPVIPPDGWPSVHLVHS